MVYILGGIKNELSIKREKEREGEERNKGPRTKHVHGVVIITTLLLTVNTPPRMESSVV